LELLVSNKLAKCIELEFRIQNIVATLDFQRVLDVKKVTRSLPNYIYEPDNFPGIIYKHNGRISCLIFASGKVVIAGVKSEDQLKNIADELSKML